MMAGRSARQILVVGAHPPDAVLGAGGTMALHVRQGDHVTALILVDGPTARPAPAAPPTVAAHDAYRALGIQDVRCGGLPDRGLDALPLLEVIRPLSRVIEDLRPQIVYTSHGANHGHPSVFAATLVAVRPFGGNPVKRVLSYAAPSPAEWGPPSPTGAFLPNVYVDIAATLGDKLNACAACRETLDGEDRFSHPRLLDAVRLCAQTAGIAVGMQAAEAFMLIRDLVDDDETLRPGK